MSTRCRAIQNRRSHINEESKPIHQRSALVYMVRIPGFHPGGPGSIPGCGTFSFLVLVDQIFARSLYKLSITTTVAFVLGFSSSSFVSLLGTTENFGDDV